MLKKMRTCESCQVRVVDEEAICEELEKCLQENKSSSTPLDVEALIEKHTISTWPHDDLKTRMAASVAAEEDKRKGVEASYSLKSATGDGSGKVKLRVKGGAVVDPDSGLEDSGHVMVEPSTRDVFSCVLGLVDISRGSNSFYKLQIIEHDKHRTYTRYNQYKIQRKLTLILVYIYIYRWYLFRAWGRVGTTIGGNKLETYHNKDDVLEAFEALYLEKTGNEWSDRKSANKVPGKFYPLEMDYGDVRFFVCDHNTIKKD